MRTTKHGSPGLTRHCDNCGAPLGQLPPSAQGKRFCCNSCRNTWHSERRKLAWEQFQRDQQQASKDEEG